MISFSEIILLADLLILLFQSEMVEQNRREYLFRVIKKNKNIMKYAKGGKYTLAKMIWNIFGFRLGSNILIKLRK